MKTKYLLTNNTVNNELIIKEFAELDKNLYSCICEESYNSDEIKSAASKSKTAIVDLLRTRKFYPIIMCAERIADSVMELYESDQESVEVLFNDIEVMQVDDDPEQIDDENEDVQIDELLKDDDAKSDDENNKESVVKDAKVEPETKS